MKARMPTHGAPPRPTRGYQSMGARVERWREGIRPELQDDAGRREIAAQSGGRDEQELRKSEEMRSDSCAPNERAKPPASLSDLVGPRLGYEHDMHHPNLEQRKSEGWSLYEHASTAGERARGVLMIIETHFCRNRTAPGFGIYASTRRASPRRESASVPIEHQWPGVAALLVRLNAFLHAGGQVVR